VDVSEMQRKLSLTAQEKPEHKFGDLYSLLCNEVWLRVAAHNTLQNSGSNTAGIDGMTKANFLGNFDGQIIKLKEALKAKTLEPMPVRRVYIPKPNSEKKRPLGIPTLLDRIVQNALRMILEPIWESDFSIHSYGFRPNRSTYDAISNIQTRLAGNGWTYQWIIEGDIASYFDGISHDWLLAHIPMDKAILSKWLKAGYMERNVFHPTEAGTPQGGICSPVIANLVLDGLEAHLRTAFPRYVWNGHKQVCPKVNLIRFADDFIITGATKELLEHEVTPLVEAFLRERGLELSREKTVITHIADGCDFLGQNIRKYHGKLLIRPSAKSIKSVLRKVRTVIKGNKSATAGNLICHLNPIIRGWAMYHRHGVSSKVFQAVDHAIFQALWRWAKRRHPNKGVQWVKARYFHTIDEHNWVFSGKVRGPKGQPQTVHLFTAHSLPIQRHIKINNAVNPYDPQWELYLEKRLSLKMAASLKGRMTVLSLWKRQHGRCPHCGEAITTMTGWHNHHVVWRSHGGRDTPDNRVLLHPTCHSQVHSTRGSTCVPHPVTRMFGKA